MVWRAVTGGISEGIRAEEKGKGEKITARRSQSRTTESGVTSGRLIEHQDQVGVLLFKALPAISAIGGLWGTKCARWPTLAALTTAV